MSHGDAHFKMLLNINLCPVAKRTSKKNKTKIKDFLDNPGNLELLYNWQFIPVKKFANNITHNMNLASLLYF